MRNICSSPKYAADGWNPVSVRLKGTMAIGRFNLIPRSGLEPTVRIDICESAVLNHFAIKAFCTLRNNNWIQLLFRKVQNALIAKWLSTALSQMSILTVGSSPDRGMRLNLPIAIVPLRRTDTGFQPSAAYLGDEQMLRILIRGHSVPFNFAIKAFCTSRNNN